MIKAGDDVDFCLEGHWYQGKVIIVTPVPEANANYRDYYIYPSQEYSSIKKIELADEKYLANLQKDITRFNMVHNIKDFGHKKVVVFGISPSSPNSINDIRLAKSSITIQSNIGVDGCNCATCHQFFHMAEANQPDNTFKCFSCKNNPMRQYY